MFVVGTSFGAGLPGTPHFTVEPRSPMVSDRMRRLAHLLRFVVVLSIGMSELGCNDPRTGPTADGGMQGADGGATGADGGTSAPAGYLAIGYGRNIDGPMGCAVRADGTIACNAPPAAIPTATGRAIAVDPPCALLEGGLVACGDSDGDGPAPPLALEGEGFEQLAITSTGTVVCGRRGDGTVSCHGGFSAMRWDVGGGFVSIRGGPALCAITEGGEVLCTTASMVLQRVPLSGPATDAQGDVSRGCAILTGGELECWGSHSFDPLPFGPFVRLAVDPEGLGCAIREDGTGTCFGPEAPLAVGGRFADVSVSEQGGWWLTTDGSVERINPVSVLAPGRRFERVNGQFVQREGVWECGGSDCAELTLRQPYVDVASIRDSFGEPTVCGIRPDATLECNRGSAPTGEFLQIAGDSRRFCALRRDGSISCWGFDPDVESPSGQFEMFDLHASTACGVHPDGTLACWGSQTEAQQTGIPTSSDWAAVSAGFNGFHCALARDGRVECWGDGAPAASAGPYLAVSARFQSYTFEARGVAIDSSGRMIELSPAGAAPVFPPGEEVAPFAGLFGNCGLTAEGDVLCASIGRYRWMAGR